MIYKAIKRKRIIKSVKEVNNLINSIDKYGLKVVPLGIGSEWKTLEQYKASSEGKRWWKGLSFNIIIEVKDTKLEITTKYGSELLKACTYIFNLNEEDMFVQSGIETFSQLNRWFKAKRRKKNE